MRHLGGWLDEVSGRKGCETPETVQHQVKNHKATSRRGTPKAGLRVVTTLISTSWKRGASLRPLGYNSKFRQQFDVGYRASAARADSPSPPSVAPSNHYILTSYDSVLCWSYADGGIACLLGGAG